MKYTVETTINLPVNEVAALFENPDNLKLWQPGLISFEHLSGKPGTVGAKSRMKYKMGSREIEMIETITAKKFPYQFHANYEAKGVFNIVKNYFDPIGEKKTKYISEQEFEFSGFMKLMGWLMPGVFKKQSKKYLKDFKAFAEKQTEKFEI